jgi:hypothetical protein
MNKFPATFGRRRSKIILVALLWLTIGSLPAPTVTSLWSERVAQAQAGTGDPDPSEYDADSCPLNDPCAQDACCTDHETACINEGGDWDSINCVCNFSCDPGGYLEADCFDSGGDWDADTCTCQTTVCNPGAPEQYEIDQGYEQPCRDGYLVDRWWHTYLYVQYCQDGTVYNSWVQTAEETSPTGEPCDPVGGGGGGGGDDCWYDLDCWCAENPGDPDCGYDDCLDEYCWLE